MADAGSVLAWAIILVSLITIVALRWDNRGHPHIWRDEDEE